jgi:glycosyltransferase involved in cell wall biosynthesis
MELDRLKIAIVHDWLVSYAGADRVVDQLHMIFPNAPIYTLVYDKKQMPDRFRKYDIRTTAIQKIPFATNLYKYFFTMMPLAFERLDLTPFDLVISSCSSCSKGIITRPDAIHICYCHTPTRYIWDFYYSYLSNAGWLKRLMIPHIAHKMRIWDKVAADRVDYFIANSKFVAQRIQKYYRRDSNVIYPCVHLNEYPIVDKPDEYYLMVGRFTFYKRFDLGIAACTKLGKNLIVVGKGEERKRLQAIAGPTVSFKGALSDDEIKRLYTHAKGFIFPGEEDFGITPVEAQSAGCPVLAYGSGGALETVLAGQTGVFFYEQTVESVIQCIEHFENASCLIPRSKIREHALSFSEQRFRSEIADFCRKVVQLDDRSVEWKSR